VAPEAVDGDHRCHRPPAWPAETSRTTSTARAGAGSCSAGSRPPGRRSRPVAGVSESPRARTALRLHGTVVPRCRVGRRANLVTKAGAAPPPHPPPPPPPPLPVRPGGGRGRRYVPPRWSARIDAPAETSCSGWGLDSSPCRAERGRGPTRISRGGKHRPTTLLGSHQGPSPARLLDRGTLEFDRRADPAAGELNELFGRYEAGARAANRRAR